MAASAQTRRQMTALVRQWERGHEPRAVFARRHGVTVGRFDYWKRRVRDAGERPPVSFAPVEIVPESPAAPTTAIEVALVSGERLTIPGGVSSEHLRLVLAALRTPC